MGFVDAVKTGFRNYVNFEGRATRSEYWWWTLFSVVGQIIFSIIDGVLGTVGIFTVIFYAAVLIPSLAVMIRRLHDLDRTGWWALIALIPLIGAIVLLVWFCTKGTDGDNRFGAQRHPMGA